MNLPMLVYSPFFIDNLGSAPLALKSPLVKLRSSFMLSSFNQTYLHLHFTQNILQITHLPLLRYVICERPLTYSYAG